MVDGYDTTYLAADSGLPGNFSGGMIDGGDVDHSQDPILLAPPTGSTSTSYQNALGGDIYVAPVPEIGGFSVVYGGISQSVCSKLVNRLAPAFLLIGSESQANNIKAGAGSKINVTNLTDACNKPTVKLAFSAR